MSNKVYITDVQKYLPNTPVSNEDMEDYLGEINNKRSKSKSLILRNNGIKSRYYALDKHGIPTHSNAELTFAAVSLLQREDFDLDEVEVLSCGTSTPDVLIPSHAAMVHGLLGRKSVELNSSSGVCCAGMNALKYGFMSVKSGSSKNAVCTGSERVSSWMLSNKFEAEIENLEELEQRPILAFKKDFLRWMLSDGAGAFLLQNEPLGPLSLELCWMESYSFAHELEVCMYAGGEKTEGGQVKSWSDYDPESWSAESIFSLKQDVKVLDEFILDKGVESTALTFEKHGITPEDIDFFLPHISSLYFKEKLYEKFDQAGLQIPMDKWFLNLPQVGNIGSASIYVALEELFHSGRLQSGQTILLSVPESARFSYAYAFLKVV